METTKERSAGIVTYYGDPQGTLEYLVLHYTSGHWDFPKGKLEVGETEPDAAVRELKEETGLSVDLDTNFERKLHYFFRNKQGELISKTVILFVGQSQTKNVTLSDEHIGYSWLSFQEARELLTFKNAQRILSMAHNYITRNRVKISAFK